MKDETESAAFEQKNSRRPFTKGSLLPFDYQSTTPCSQEVLNEMLPYWNEFWGNPSSRQNRSGIQAAAAVTLSREKLATCLDVAPERLIFTSGATEANNLALLGHARAKAIKHGSPGHLITLATEHHAVLDPLRQLKREGFRLTELRPGHDGILSRNQLVDAFERDTFLVSMMFANNEIGVIQPLKEMSELCRDRGISFHSDVVQGFGYLPFKPDELGLDFVSLSGHKLYGPKGVGALLFRPELPILPLQWGGGQEQGLRAGTIPVPLVVGFAKAAEIAIRELHVQQERFCLLRNTLWEGLRQEIPDLMLNGAMNPRLTHNLNFTVPGVRGSNLHRQLRPYLNCSSGSACSNGEPSHVLSSIGRSFSEAEASLRLSLGRDTTESEVKQAIDLISTVVDQLRSK